MLEPEHVQNRFRWELVLFSEVGKQLEFVIREWEVRWATFIHGQSAVEGVGHVVFTKKLSFRPDRLDVQVCWEYRTMVAGPVSIFQFLELSPTHSLYTKKGPECEHLCEARRRKVSDIPGR